MYEKTGAQRGYVTFQTSHSNSNSYTGGSGSIIQTLRLFPAASSSFKINSLKHKAQV